MLGHVMLDTLSAAGGFEAYGTLRSASAMRKFPPHFSGHLLSGISVEDSDSVAGAFEKVRPDVVINCVGLVKQLAESNDPLLILPTNALFPHRLARLCELSGSRLIHISTDCVFAGTRGGYLESDVPDAADLYGRSKAMGEVTRGQALTIRTSIIGRELSNPHGLVDWYLSQKTKVQGYTKALFSGLPTIELCEVIRDVIIPKKSLQGLYHVSSSPISKHELLKIISDVYGGGAPVVPDASLVLDRTLSSQRFFEATGYAPPPWRDLVERMSRYQFPTIQ